MYKYLSILLFLFIGEISSLAQAKKTKYAPKKIYTKPAPAVTKKTNPIIIPTKTEAKSIGVTDTTKTKKQQTANKTPTKVQKPVMGPLNDGPKSYSSGNATDNNREATKTIEKPKSTKTKITQTKTLASKPQRIKTHWLKNNITFGIKSGLNIANIANFSKLVYSGVQIPKAKKYNGITTGIVAEYQLIPKLVLQSELLLTQNGSQIDEKMNLFKYRINYLQLPILAKFEFGNGKLNYFGATGLYFGYAISKKSEREIGGKIYNDKLEFNTKYNSFGEKDNRFDYGPIISAGIQYQLKNWKVSFENRYQYGMADPLSYKTEKPTLLGNTGRNRSFSSSFTLFYTLK
jgi:Outer membrane protein beta-barrel domain